MYRRLLLISVLVGFSTYFFARKQPLQTDYTTVLECTTDFVPSTCNQTQFLFSHGYIRNNFGIGKRQVSRFIKNGIVPESAWFFEYNDTDHRTNLAQTIDCSTLADAHQQLLETTQTDSCVLVGLSRGGSTAFMFTALHKPEHVKALILESPFAHVDDVAYQLGKQYIPWAPFKKQIALYVMRYLFPSFDPLHISPLHAAESIDHELPVLFICSQEDDLVPASSTLQLVNALQRAGHPHVYALVLQRGEHGYLSYNETAQKVTHAFLNYYNLDDNAPATEADLALLQSCYYAPLTEAVA